MEYKVFITTYVHFVASKLSGRAKKIIPHYGAILLIFKGWFPGECECTWSIDTNSEVLWSTTRRLYRDCIYTNPTCVNNAIVTLAVQHKLTYGQWHCLRYQQTRYDKGCGDTWYNCYIYRTCVFSRIICMS